MDEKKLFLTLALIAAKEAKEEKEKKKTPRSQLLCLELQARMIFTLKEREDGKWNVEGGTGVHKPTGRIELTREERRKRQRQDVPFYLLY